MLDASTQIDLSTINFSELLNNTEVSVPGGVDLTNITELLNTTVVDLTGGVDLANITELLNTTVVNVTGGVDLANSTAVIDTIFNRTCEANCTFVDCSARYNESACWTQVCDDNCGQANCTDWIRSADNLWLGSICPAAVEDEASS